MLNDLCSNVSSRDVELNRKLLKETDPRDCSIIRFLCDAVRHNSEHIRRLFECVRNSRIDYRLSVSAANAMTILVGAGVILVTGGIFIAGATGGLVALSVGDMIR